MNELIAMGFDEASSQAALRKTNNNLDQAIDFLLSNPSGVFSSDGHVSSICVKFDQCDRCVLRDLYLNSFVKI